MSDELINDDLNKNTDFLVKKINIIFAKYISSFSRTEDYCNEQFAVLNQLKTDLEAKKSSALRAIQESKARRDCLETNFNSRKTESSRLKTELNILDDKYKVLVSEYENLEEKCLELKSKLNISAHDKYTLELDKKKLDLYGDATNIVWDYSVPINSTISGCVRNKKKNYLQTFVFKNDEISAKDAQGKLWEEIEKGIQDNCNENDENVAINK